MTETALAKLDTAKRVLAQAKDLPITLDFRDKTVALEAFFKAKGSFKEANRIKAIQLQLERHAGGFLRESVPHRGGRPSREKLSHSVTVFLKKHGITRNESSWWQKMDRLPLKDFDEYINGSLEKQRELARSEVLRLYNFYISAKRKETILRNRSNTLRSIVLKQGDFRKLWPKYVKPDSVDFVFTDPPYGKAGLDNWEDLGDFAARTLKPDGYLFTYSGKQYLDKVVASLSNHLQYYWTLCIFHQSQTSKNYGLNIKDRWKPILVFTKEKGRRHQEIFDLLMGEKGRKELHEWAQSQSEAEYVLDKFANGHDLVVDPMCGTGTILRAAHKMHCRSVGFEQDPETFKLARNLLGQNINN